MRRQFLIFYVIFTITVILIAAVLPFVIKREVGSAMTHHYENSLTPLVAGLKLRAGRTPLAQPEVDAFISGLNRPFPFSVTVEVPPVQGLAVGAMRSLAETGFATVDDGRRLYTYASIGPETLVRIEALMPPPPPLFGPLHVILYAVLALSGVAAYLLLRPVEKRILDLVDAEKKFGAGDLRVRAKVGAIGTVDQLEKGFNLMAERTEALVTRQRELLRDVSHDLRTPVSRLFFMIDEARDAATIDEKDYHLARIDKTLSQLNDIVESLMVYQRLASGNEPVRREEVSLPPLFNDMADMVSGLSADIVLETICVETRVYAEPKLFLSALSNLVTNALAHTNGRIRITTESQEGFTVIAVEDDGPGVAEEHLASIFEPFFRADEARRHPCGGSGLGLAIVKKIMELHGGTILVGSSELGGARFTLKFPLPLV